MTPSLQALGNSGSEESREPFGEDVVPGPGPETAFQQFCGAEYERVLGIARGMIRDSTGIDAGRAEELARKIAAAHADTLYARLTGEKPVGGGRTANSRKGHGPYSGGRARSIEMQRNVAGARMEV